MIAAIVNACKTFAHRIKETIKNFTKPETAVYAKIWQVILAGYCWKEDAGKEVYKRPFISPPVSYC